MGLLDFLRPKRRRTVAEEELSFPKIDLHAHLLPGVDDGSDSPEMSLEMMKAALGAGVVHINATAHHRGNLAPEEGEIREAFALVRSQRRAEGLPLSLSCSLETEFFPGAENFLLAAPAACLGRQGRHCLLEFTMDVNRQAALGALFQLALSGLRPVVVHPERFYFVQSHPEVAEEMRQRGALLMPNATSFAGHYGRSARETAEAILKADAVDALASDAHRPGYYAEYLDGLRAVAELRGPEAVKRYTWSNPCRILGYEPETEEDDCDPFETSKNK